MVGNQWLGRGSFFGRNGKAGTGGTSETSGKAGTGGTSETSGTSGSASRTGDCGTGGTGGSASRTGDCGTGGANGRRGKARMGETGETCHVLKTVYSYFVSLIYVFLFFKLSIVCKSSFTTSV